MEATWEQIEALFEEALMHDKDERMVWLRAACVGRPAIFGEVESMLAAHAQPLGIETRLLTAVAPMLPNPLVGVQVGPFRLIELLGHGGMGSVWLARQADGVVDRQVAVKLVRLPHTAKEAGALRRRFEAERRILARLEHPGIVRLLEAGTATPVAGAGESYPYFAMDYVSGVPLTTYAEEHRLDAADRLRLFVQVCEAVHHAHQRLVVHRDLKPSNILVAEDADGRPQIKLLDFGIARLLEDESEGATIITEPGVRPMTRTYAAPEQIRGEPATTATDVYALGVVLYELLTGRHPLDAPSAAQLEQAILTQEPPRPSVVVTKPTQIEPHRLRGDLDAIVLTALRKEPEARYAAAEAFSADIRRHLDGLPVSARAPSAGYRLRAFVRRHKTGVALAGSAFLLLIAFTAALAVQQRTTARERDTAQATADFLEGLFGAANPYADERQDTLRARDLLARGVARARVELADEPLVRARLLHVIGRSFVRLGAHDEAEDPLTEAVALLRVEDDMPTLIGSLTELASVQDALSNYDRAEELGREAIALAEESGDWDQMAQAEQVLAETLLDTDRSAEAETLLRGSLARQRAVSADTTTAILEAQRLLAMALLNEGRLDEAEPLFRAARESLARRYGPDDAHSVGVLTPLTFLYLSVGRMAEAEEAGAQAVAILRDTQPGSRRLSQALSIYASVRRRQGQLDEAKALLDEALDIPEIRPGNQAILMGALASVLHEKGNLDDAIAAQRHAASLLQSDVAASINAATHAATLALSQTKLAGFLMEADRFQEAETLLLAALAEQNSGEASAHPGTPRVIAALVALYDEWGNLDEAALWRAQLDD